MFCKAPFVGLTIDPQGYIALCCTSDRHYLKTHIEDVKDLNDFFLDKKMEQVREMFSTKKLSEVDLCKSCHNYDIGLKTELQAYDKFEPSNPLSIQYLEITTSNVCNLSCVMCTPYFSTKSNKLVGKKDSPWRTKHINTLSDESVNKIRKVLPYLKKFQIKGGEPFADKKNIMLLRELLQVNDTCLITINSNAHQIPKDYINIIKNMKNPLDIVASIDGTNEIYEWIRGGSFNTTVNSMERFVKETGRKFLLGSTITAFNFFNLKDIIIHFEHTNTSLIKSYAFTNIVNVPAWASPNMYPQEIIDENLLNHIKYFNYFQTRPTIAYKNLYYDLIEYQDDANKKIYAHQLKKYTEFFNSQRGIDITKYNPKLKLLIE